MLFLTRNIVEPVTDAFVLARFSLHLRHDKRLVDKRQTLKTGKEVKKEKGTREEAGKGWGRG